MTLDKHAKALRKAARTLGEAAVNDRTRAQLEADFKQVLRVVFDVLVDLQEVPKTTTRRR